MSALGMIEAADWQYAPVDEGRPARAARRRPSATEVGQVGCGLMAIVGLWLLLPVAWFLLVNGVVGLVGFWAVEYFASAQPSESDGA